MQLDSVLCGVHADIDQVSREIEIRSVWFEVVVVKIGSCGVVARLILKLTPWIIVGDKEVGAAGGCGKNVPV